MRKDAWEEVDFVQHLGIAAEDKRAFKASKTGEKAWGDIAGKFTLASAVCGGWFATAIALMQERPR
jgi:hypothetical protein